MEIITQTIKTRPLIVAHIVNGIEKAKEAGAGVGKINLSLDLTRPEWIETLITTKEGNVKEYAFLTLTHVKGDRTINIEGDIDLDDDNAILDAVNHIIDAAEVNEKQEQKKEEFIQACYEAYQLDWMISHGYSLADYREVLVELMGQVLDAPFMVAASDEDLVRLSNKAEEYFMQDEGFNGTLFASKKEFIGSEFQDPDYMEHLLSMMPDKVEKKAYWKKLVDPELV